MLWLLKLLHPTVIVVRDGRCRLAKGQVRTSVLQDLNSVLREFGVTTGTIAIDGRGRAQFSTTIPSDCHQRLRNLVVGI